MSEDRYLCLYIDGSYRPMTDSGGMGMKVVFPEHLNKPDELVEFHGYISTNAPRMEVHACIEALRFACRLPEDIQNQYQRILIFTDSTYVSNGFGFCRTWKERGWKLKAGNELSDPDLWKEVLRLRQKVQKPCEARYVMPDSHHKPHHIDAHRLAKLSSLNAGHRNSNLGRKDVIRSVRRKLSKEPTRRTNILPSHQEVCIHVFSQRTLRGHIPPVIRYGIELWEPSSQSFVSPTYINGNSEVDVRRGHYFRIMLSTDESQSRIIEATEIDKADLPKLSDLQSLRPLS